MAKHTQIPAAELEAFRTQVKDIASQQGLSQKALGKMAGVSQAAISTFLTGGGGLAIPNAFRLARALRIELALAVGLNAPNGVASLLERGEAKADDPYADFKAAGMSTNGFDPLVYQMMVVEPAPLRQSLAVFLTHHWNERARATIESFLIRRPAAGDNKRTAEEWLQEITSDFERRSQLYQTPPQLPAPIMPTGGKR